MNFQILLGASETQTIPWDTIITNTVVVIGFIVSAVMTRRNIKAEIEKMKTSVAIEALQDALLKLCTFFQDTKLAKTEAERESATYEMMKAVQKVVAYGSRDAVSIAASFQQNNFTETPDKYKTLAYYALLAAQLKYDITGEVVSPEVFFKVFMKDYGKIENELKKAINGLTEELGLSKRLNC